MAHANRTALSIGIYINGQFGCFNYGKLSSENSAPPTPQTIYEIGSITKTFTGVLLAKAVQSGKLRPEDDIRKYLPGEYPDLEYRGHAIRVLDLANQTSGLPQNSTPNPAGSTPDMTVKLEMGTADAEFLEWLHSVKFNREPGHDLEYSNAGFSLLGIILERVYGMSYERLVKTEIAAPLGMRDTAIVLNPQQTALFASGHADDGASRPSLLLDVPVAGGLRSNVEDMLLYVRANATASDGAYYASHQLTSGKPSGGVGLGWDIDKTADGQDRVLHGGGMPGYSSYLAVVPKRDFVIILETNQSGVLGDLRKLGDAITVTLLK
jgi:serine-type D-Ala-D-Ala carboxypeptidase/endopeptidase